MRYGILIIYWSWEYWLTTTNQVLLVMGVILWSVAFIVGIILSVIKLKTLVYTDGRHIFLPLCIVVTIMLSLVLWVTVEFQVGLQIMQSVKVQNNYLVVIIIFRYLTFFILSDTPYISSLEEFGHSYASSLHLDLHTKKTLNVLSQTPAMSTYTILVTSDESDWSKSVGYMATATYTHTFHRACVV